MSATNPAGATRQATPPVRLYDATYTRLSDRLYADIRRETWCAVAAIAARWHDARQRREANLRPIETDATFDGQQAFLRTAAMLAEQGRLSRFLYLAE